MIEGELLYFTPAEFVVMMELAGEKPYSMLFVHETEIDDVSLTEAFASLFQRNLISRNGEGFIRSARGQLFEELRQARFVVMVSAENPRGYTAGCYVAEDVLWLVECIDTVLSKQFRIQKMGRGDVKQWLLDKGAFGPPILDEENAKDLAQELRDKLEDPTGSRMLKLERYYNGGDLVCMYELLAMSECNVIVRREMGNCAAEIYTTEAMSHMLTECFGRD